MRYVTSADGTSIAIDETGSRPPVVLVCGGSCDRSANAPLAAALSEQYTVLNYDRRGRGDSGDAAPYAVGREIEDIAAVIDSTGGPVSLFGTSSGAVLAFEATAAGLPVMRLALWEPPWMADDSAPLPPDDTPAVYERLVAEGRRGDAVEYFMAQVVGLPAEFVAAARSQPWWASQEAIAHTLAYDAYVMAGYRLPSERVAAVRTPTLVLDGANSPQWMRTTAATVAELMPNGEYQTLARQEHNVDVAVLAPVLAEFYRA